MNISDLINSLRAQKNTVDSNLKEISKRCTSLRDRREKLLIERDALMETHVTEDDFIECIVEAVREKKVFYPTLLFRALRNEACQSKLVENPSFKKMTHDKYVSNAAGLILSDVFNPDIVSVNALFYILNDLLADKVKEALRDGFKAGTPVTRAIKKPFATGKPMKELAARIDKIDGEITEINRELDELKESAGLFGASV